MYSDDVLEKFELWKEYYDIPEYVDFYILTLLDLQEEFQIWDREDIEHRMKLFELIDKLQQNLRVFENKEN